MTATARDAPVIRQAFIFELSASSALLASALSLFSKDSATSGVAFK